jgi:hypothetical protein
MLPILVAAAAIAATGQDTQSAATAGVTNSAPPTSIITAAPPSTPSAPEPTPLAGALRANPTGAAPEGATRYDPSFFAELRPNTALDMINRLPGFTVQSGAEVRGFSGAASNVLIDGERPTSKQDDIENILKRLPAGQVDHIDLIRGGASGIDMQGQTVIANVVRKGSGGTTGVIAVAGNIYSDGRVTPAVRLEGSKRWGQGKSLEGSAVLAGFVDDAGYDGPRVRTDANGKLIERAQVTAPAGGGQGVFTAAYATPAAGGKFKINGSLLLQDYQLREDDLVTEGDDIGLLSSLRDRQKKLQSELGVHYEHGLGAKTSLETIFIQQFNKQRYVSHFYTIGEDDLFAESDTSGETIGRAVVRYRASDKLQAEAAVEGAYNFLDTNTSFALNAEPVQLPAANVRVTEKRGEASAQATWTPSRKITLEAGMRVEVSTISSSGDVDLQKTLTYPKPRAVLTWSPTKSDQFRIRGEREVGQLNFSDFVASSALSTGQVLAGNPDLVPQRAWVAEAAYERRFWTSGSIGLTLRHSWISDAVDRIPVCVADLNGDGVCDDTDANGAPDIFDAPGNIGGGKETDVELSLTIPLDRLLIKHAQLKGSGIARRSEVTDPTTGETRRISGQHPFRYELHFSQDLPRWKANWGIDVYNRWTETYYRFNEVDRYALKTSVTVFGEWKPKPDLSLRMEVNNVGGRGYQRTILSYDGPRDTSPLQFRDDRQLHFGPEVYLRVRKSLGG